MIKLSNNLVKGYLFDNKITHKDLILVILLEKYNKINKYGLEKERIYIKDLKERCLKINIKLGYEFITYSKEKNAEYFSINPQYKSNLQTGYIKLPFSYNSLSSLNAEQFKLFLFILFFTKIKEYDFKQEYKVKDLSIHLIEKVFGNYKTFEKIFKNDIRQVFKKKLTKKISKNNKKTKFINWVIFEVKVNENFFDLVPVNVFSDKTIIEEKTENSTLSAAEIIEKIKESLRKDGTISATMNKIFGIYMLENDISNIKDLLSFKNFENDILQFKKELFLIEVI